MSRAFSQPKRLAVVPGSAARVTGFTLQALAKLALGEGERVVLLSFPQPEQGAFALATGLGSVAVRTVLAPFEESAFLAFSHTR